MAHGDIFDSEKKITEKILALQPFIGTEQVKNLLMRYRLGNSDRKSTIQRIVNILSLKYFGDSLDSQVLFIPINRELSGGDYENIGHVVCNGRTLWPFSLLKREISENLAIFGRSGSGKSTLLFNIILSILRKDPDIKFILFDWKKEIRGLINDPEIAKDIRIYTVGREDIAPIRFNPLIPPLGCIVTNYMEQLIDIILRSFYVGEGVADILTRAIHTCYSEFGVLNGTAKRFPTFKDVHNKIENFKCSGERERQWKISALRTTRSLIQGEFGKALNIQQQYPLEETLEKNVVIELDSLSSVKRSFFVSAFLHWLYNYLLSKRSIDKDYNQDLKRIVVVEEAHNIARKNLGTSIRESVIETILRQARFLGLGMILVDQTPSEIAPVSIANTHTHINLNQRNSADIVAASRGLLLNPEQRNYLSQLKVGEAIVRLSNRYTLPFMIQFPSVPLKDKVVTDEMIRAHMQFAIENDGGSFGYFQPINQRNGVIPVISEKHNIKEDELEFIKDIIEKPFIGVAERYRKLGNMNIKEGNRIKRKLIKEWIIKVEEVNTGNARIVLLGLTKIGEEIAKEYGLDIKKINGRAGLEHEYYRDIISKYLQKLGYNVEFEVPSNGEADIVATKGDLRIAIEVETGKTNLERTIQNIERNLNAGYERVICAATNKNTLKEIQQKLTEKAFNKDERIKVILASQFYLSTPT